MSILIDKKTRIICQGITGTQATFHVRKSLDYGTNVVGGVTPGKGNTQHLGLPVFNTAVEAKKHLNANASVMFVPASQVKEAIKDAIEAELELVVCIADRVPVRDMLEIKAMLKDSNTKLIGPNTPGLIVPGLARLGIFPENIHTHGHIGIVSRSSTLTYEAVIATTIAGLGQSTVIGLGDDMLIGMDFEEILQKFHEDEETKAIIMIGKHGGTFEEAGATYYKSLKNKKPIIGYVAGNAMPFGSKIGYAGDIITNGHITVQDKKDSMIDSGMIVVNRISEIQEELLKIFTCPYPLKKGKCIRKKHELDSKNN